MRIACFGFIDRDGGSIASAGFWLAKSLLEEGVEIDLFALRGFVHPAELEIHENYRYRAFTALTSDPFDRLPRTTFTIAGQRLWNLLAFKGVCWRLERLVLEANRDRSYDAFLAFGMLPPFKLKGIPVICWPQGAPQTEWEAIRRLRALIVRLCGWTLFAKLALFYAWKVRDNSRRVRWADHIVVGSEWTRGRFIAAGAAPEHVTALPYPLDLTLFQLGDSHSAGRTVLLWLGRIDPRKRLDLLVEAFEVLADERDDLVLKVVGTPTYAPSLMELLSRSKHRDRIEYVQRVSRGEVPELLKACDLLVAPAENEDFGSAAAEAAACGKLVVLGPTNGTAQYLEGSTVMFAEYSAKHLAEAIRVGLNRGNSREDVASDTVRATLDPRRISQEFLQLVGRMVCSATSAPVPGTER